MKWSGACVALCWMWVLTSIGCASPVVGGACKDGYVMCDGRCVRLDNNFMHCGACGNECSALEICTAGECIANPDVDGGNTDGGGSGGTGGNGGMGGGGTGGSGGIVIPPDAGFPGCELGETDCNGTCAVLDNDPAHCGMCGNACAIDQFCVDGMCVDRCEDPLTFCPTSGRCVDLQTDARNCGGCERRCLSGICVEGMCQDAVPGHLIIIGHDFATSNATMARLARSAVFLASGAPVHAVTYQGTASDAAVTRINAVIEASLERAWEPLAVDTAVEMELALKDRATSLFVIYPQAGEQDMELLKFRDTHLRKLADFLRRGGIIVLFEHDPAELNGGTRNAGTHQMLGCRGVTQCTPLFEAASVARVTDSARVLINYEDGWITNGVPSAYAAARRTMSFGDVSTPGNVVATEESSGAPVIVHRLVSAAEQP